MRRQKIRSGDKNHNNNDFMDTGITHANLLQSSVGNIHNKNEASYISIDLIPRKKSLL